LLYCQGFMRDQKLDPGLKIRPTLLQNLPCTSISRFNQLAYGEVDLPHGSSLRGRV